MSEIDNFEAVPPVEHEPAEVGPSLGESLREARLARGLVYAFVAALPLVPFSPG